MRGELFSARTQSVILLQDMEFPEEGFEEGGMLLGSGDTSCLVSGGLGT